MKIRILMAVSAAAAFALPAAAQTQPAPAAQPAPAQAQPAAQVPATAADLRVGAQVVGPDGHPVGTIAEADATGAVIRSPSATQGRLNLDAFVKRGSTLVIGYTSTQFEALAGAAAQGGPDETEEPATPPTTADTQ